MEGGRGHGARLRQAVRLRGPDTGSALSHLEGGLSGRSYDAEALIGLDPADQRPLLARYDLEHAGRSLTREAMAARRSGGLWRWRELLPVRDSSFITFLGEGDTPLQPVRWPGLARLLVKRESLNPTGSFKARGMAVAVSRAAELGATHLVAPSAGNAGGALAAYAAATGVRATVIMPADAPAINQVEVLITGADLILLDGLINDCGRLAALVRDELGAFDLSTLKEPYRVEGKKTMGFELAEQLGWRLPDAIVYPTGGGTGIVGMWKAFAELEALGLIGAERPRMFSVQAQGCAPIVRAFEAGERFAAPWEGASTAAAGLRVPSAVGGRGARAPDRRHPVAPRPAGPWLREPGDGRRGRGPRGADGTRTHRLGGDGRPIRHRRRLQIRPTRLRGSEDRPERRRLLEGAGHPYAALARRSAATVHSTPL